MKNKILNSILGVSSLLILASPFQLIKHDGIFALKVLGVGVLGLILYKVMSNNKIT